MDLILQNTVQLYSRSHDLSNVHYEAPALLIAVITQTWVYSRSTREGKVGEPEKNMSDLGVLLVYLWVRQYSWFLFAMNNPWLMQNIMIITSMYILL